jgi:hypothetical protein
MDNKKGDAIGDDFRICHWSCRRMVRSLAVSFVVFLVGALLFAGYSLVLGSRHLCDDVNVGSSRFATTMDPLSPHPNRMNNRCDGGGDDDDDDRGMSARLEWRWDRNLYCPVPSWRNRTDTRGGEYLIRPPHERRKLLVLQIDPDPTGADDPLRNGRGLRRLLLEISGRPNRACARQWGFDYAAVVHRLDDGPSATSFPSGSGPWDRLRLRWQNAGWWPKRKIPPQEERRQQQHQHQRQFGGWWRSSSPHGGASHPCPAPSRPHEILVLLAYLERQLELHHRKNDTQSSSIPEDPSQPDLEQREATVLYDAVAVLPVDAIVIDMDYDLLRILPDDKLVAFSGGENGGLEQGVILFNLRHPYATAFVNEWRRLTRERKYLHCGNSPAHGMSAEESRIGRAQDRCGGRVWDTQILIQAIEGVKLENENVQSLVVRLTTTSHGFVGEAGDNNLLVIKRMVMQNYASSTTLSNSTARNALPSQSSAASDMSIALALQITADSVCYRYYPKCEVL